MCVKYSKPASRLYFCGGEGNIGMYFKLCERYLAKMPKILVWVKNGFVMKPNGYHNQYELIFFTFKDGGGGKEHWYSGRTMDEASDVWQIKRDAGSTYLHPTQKPIDLPARAIGNSSKAGDIVFEPFMGSASTMVAAHKLGRVCYGLEIDPHYCQVAIERMKKLDPEIVVKITKNSVE
jgi:DNA modification methylase